MKARIAEIFESIQGEGIYLGERQLFVRFFGCNLNCKFCDTKLTRFKEYTPEELFTEIRLSYQNRLHSISFTGGEPLLQKDFLKQTLRLTFQFGYKNYLETNGSLPDELTEVIDYLDIVAVDIKLPSSTGMDNLFWLHRRFLEIASQKEVFIKIVICEFTQEKDLLEALKMLKEINSSLVLVLQPNSYEVYNRLKTKIEYFRDLCMNAEIATCIVPQIHKILGVK